MKKIGLWAVPRSVSTAFERIFISRKDTRVLHEPFFDAYYRGNDRGSKRDLPKLDCSYRKIQNDILKKTEKPITFFKDMAFYTQGRLDIHFYEKIVNTFIIRNPKDALVSHYNISPDFLNYPEEAGYFAQHQLFTLVTKTLKQPAIVIDANDLREHPEIILKEYCNVVGIEHDSSSLKWKNQDIPEWSGWKDWHKEALESNTILNPSLGKKDITSSGLLPSKMKDLISLCETPYKQLYQHRIKPPFSQQFFGTNQHNFFSSLNKSNEELETTVRPRVCFFFDMDGVLCNSEGIHAECHSQALMIIKKKYLLKFEVPEINFLKKSLCGANANLVSNFIRNSYPEVGQFYSEYIGIASDIFLHLRNEMKNDYLIDSSINLLKYLTEKKYKTCIVSGSTRAEIKYFLKIIGLENLVPYVGSEDYTHGKPSSEPYVKAAKLINADLSRDKCIVFEDSARGIQAGKDANMFVIGLEIDPIERLGDHGADLVVQRLDDPQVQKLIGEENLLDNINSSFRKLS